MQSLRSKPVTEASPISPAQRLMTAPSAAPTMAEQVIAREMAEHDGDGEALNMMMRGMMAMVRSGRSSTSRFSTHA